MRLCGRTFAGITFFFVSQAGRTADPILLRRLRPSAQPRGTARECGLTGGSKPTKQ